MTPEQLLDAATPLPWDEAPINEDAATDADAALIVAAVNAYPDHLAAVAALKRLADAAMGYSVVGANFVEFGARDLHRATDDARAILARLKEPA